ncbi:MAG: NrfD/PsrC family molybdoenzyme membrane anchor subunit [Acidobacteriota bacterium]
MAACRCGARRAHSTTRVGEPSRPSSSPSSRRRGDRWGLWIGFDMLVGIGVAAGGFAIVAAVHVFHLDDFKPILRPTILTAFLGYLFAILALLLDLGRPWNIWHPIIMWNPRSVMFFVLACRFLPVFPEGALAALAGHHERVRDGLAARVPAV